MASADMFKDCNGKRLGAGLAWLREPPSWKFGPSGLEIVPEGKTDFFRPVIGEPHDNACLLYTWITGDFTAVADAHAALSGFGDAAALTVRSDAEHWAKICIERSPRGETSIVSVVTEGVSDDSNNELLQAPRASIRLTRTGSVFGMQYRTDAGAWRFVRAFGLDVPARLMVGLHAQAPFVSGCRATFTRFEVEPWGVPDLRSGD
jgi:regulation of enolase protein 1 (concanavalin A-like superfamily)